jgi:hypothetical protein
MRSATEVRRVIIIGKIEGVIVLAVIFMEVWVIPIICINSLRIGCTSFKIN